MKVTPFLPLHAATNQFLVQPQNSYPKLTHRYNCNNCAAFLVPVPFYQKHIYCNHKPYKLTFPQYQSHILNQVETTRLLEEATNLAQEPFQTRKLEEKSAVQAKRIKQCSTPRDIFGI